MPALPKSMGQIRKRLLTLTLLVSGVATVYFLLARLGLLMPVSAIPSVLCWTDCKAEPRIHPLIEGEGLLNEQQALADLLGGDVEQAKVSLLVEKSKYRLTVFDTLQPVKSYPVVLGGNPTGDKLYEGDQKTPEGLYYIRDLYEHPDWSKFIWLDYPTPQSWREHFRAKFAGQIGLLATIGSQIGIHGVPRGADDLVEQRANWTWGCVSLKNDDVNELYPVVRPGLLVEIVP